MKYKIVILLSCLLLIACLLLTACAQKESQPVGDAMKVMRCCMSI